jgi:hypothetical protein
VIPRPAAAAPSSPRQKRRRPLPVRSTPGPRRGALHRHPFTSDTRAGASIAEFRSGGLAASLGVAIAIRAMPAVRQLAERLRRAGDDEAALHEHAVREAPRARARRRRAEAGVHRHGMSRG